MLQDGAGLVLLDALGHHVEDVVHDRSAQFEIKVRLDALLRHRLGHALRVATLELARQQVAQPAFQQRCDAAQEEEPDAPAGRPDTAAGTLAHRTRVEPVVDQVLQVLENTRVSD